MDVTFSLNASIELDTRLAECTAGQDPLVQRLQQLRAVDDRRVAALVHQLDLPAAICLGAHDLPLQEVLESPLTVEHHLFDPLRARLAEIESNQAESFIVDIDY